MKTRWLLIDGYSLLHRIEARGSSARRTDGLARDRLIARLEELAGGLADRITVVFDGTGEGAAADPARSAVEVLYSPATRPLTRSSSGSCMKRRTRMESSSSRPTAPSARRSAPRARTRWLAGISWCSAISNGARWLPPPGPRAGRRRGRRWAIFFRGKRCRKLRREPCRESDKARDKESTAPPGWTGRSPARVPARPCSPPPCRTR